MKKITLVLYSLQLFMLTGCCWYCVDDEIPPMNNYEAVIITRAELESAVQVLPPHAVEKAGKIYIKDNLMFINDKNSGFHVYNYSNQQNPVPVAFINTPGATDLAVRNNTIYINQAVDLLTLQYNPDTNTIQVTKRNRNVFPQKEAPDASYAGLNNDEIIIDWQLK
ncbi:hypothetical protein [Flavobacterium sp.]|uniref:hypothetical protein n=1 Tax=Flavobacterium sp. TaxID=239 RepID=UPI002606DCAF|nr:hypothetical protein [Flavobacterium sp.]